MKRLFGLLLSGALIAGFGGAALAQSNQNGGGVKQDIKDVGNDTKKAAKVTGKAVKNTTKKVVNKAAKATSKGAEKVQEKTK
jgi:hypothetical protein